MNKKMRTRCEELKRFWLIVLLLTAYAVHGSAQWTNRNIIEGESFENIRIGRSTEVDVIARFGTDYKLINHNDHSFELLFRELGLGFYYCYNDPKKEIFSVEFQSPNRAVTSKGVVLGLSTLADVFRLYGPWEESSAGFEYDGVYFDITEDHEGLDAADARTVPKSAERPVVEAEKKASPPTGFSIAGLDSSSVRYRKSRVGKKKKAAELSALKKKVVRRIELFEKGGLRQCHVRFPGRN